MRQTMNYARVLSALLFVGMTAGAGAPEVRYFDDGGNRIPCTVYPPLRPGDGAPRGGLVVHLPGAGGSHTFYNLSRPPYAVLRQMLSERGYWILVPSLGNSWMNDQAIATLDKLIAQMCAAETINPARVSIIGTSMGAGSGLIYVSQRPQTIRSICAIFPMTDFTTWMKETPRFAGSIAQAYGLDPKAPGPVFADRSPLRHPEAFAAVPVYLLHGDTDTVVPPHHSRDFAVALKAKGCAVTYHEVPGFGHEDKVAEAYQKEIADFLTGAPLQNTTK